MNNHKWLTASELVNLSLILLFFICGILPAIWFAIFDDLPIFWLQEDGLYESFAVLACLFGSVISFVAFYNSGNKLIKRNLWLFLFSLALLGLAGEEISWGQRIFGLEIPAKILQSNFQNEFNLHNAKFIQASNNLLSVILTQLLMAYLLIFPLGLAIFPSINKFFINIRIPVPSLLVAFIALLIKIANSVCYKVIYSNNYKSDFLHIGEAFESLLEICLVLVVVELLIRQIIQQKREKLKDELISFSSRKIAEQKGGEDAK